MVAHRAKVRATAHVGPERRNHTPARCGPCRARASNQMLRRIISTAERTVTRSGNKKTIDMGDAIRERPPRVKMFLVCWFAVGCSHVSGLFMQSP
jgi:hypothetical protein